MASILMAMAVMASATEILCIAVNENAEYPLLACPENEGGKTKVLAASQHTAFEKI